jgi:glucan phosphoethanolaminetransferase (alkaline phosphatase superfamily)
MISIVLYAPFWLLAGLSKERRRPAERALKAWPLVAVLSLAGADYLLSQCNDYPIYCLARLASPTCWSVGLCALTVLFALASLFSALAVWRAQKQQVRRWVRIYSAVVSLALLVASSYLAYWGLIGFRSWIQL